MSRSVLRIGILILVAGASLAFLVATDEADPAAIEKRVAELEAKVKDLEGKLQGCETRLAQAGALEEEAQAAFNEVRKLADQEQYDQAKTAMAAFQQKYGQTQTAKRAAGLAQDLAVLGKTMPEKLGIEKWFQGESQVELSGQKPTLLVFWEEWCPHCRREVPKIQQIYTGHKEQGLQVLALTRCSKTSTEEKVQAFITESQVTYPIAKENGEVATYFNVSGIPAAALVKNGKVVWRGHPANVSDEMLKKWL